MKAGFNEPIEPMTLGNMRANGVRSPDVSCWNCHHRAILTLQLRFLKVSESMGNHDSKIVDAGGVD
jgi:hypothetical protein